MPVLTMAEPAGVPRAAVNNEEPKMGDQHVAMLKRALILAVLLGAGGLPAAYADPTTNYSYPHLYDAGVPFYQYHYVYRAPRALGRAGLAVRRRRR